MTRSHSHCPLGQDSPAAQPTTPTVRAATSTDAVPPFESPPRLHAITAETSPAVASPCAPAVPIQRARRFNDHLPSSPARESLQHVRDLRALQETVGRLEESQRIAGLGYWSFDAAHGSGQWSDECFRITGISAATDPLTYRELSRLVHPDDRPQLKDRIDAALHDGKTFEIEIRLFSLDGDLRWVRLIAQPVRNEIGQICRLHGTVMEVTHRKLIEQRQSMEHGVTHLLAESGSAHQVIPGIIETICGGLGWIGGALWMLDAQDETLRQVAWWANAGSRAEALFQGCPKTITPVAAKQGLLAREIGRAHV